MYVYIKCQFQELNNFSLNSDIAKADVCALVLGRANM